MELPYHEILTILKFTLGKYTYSVNGILGNKPQDNEIKFNHIIIIGLAFLKNFEYEIDLKPDGNFEIRPHRSIFHFNRILVKVELDTM